MDAAGIDVQILSHCPPGAQCFDESELERALAVNDKLKNTIDNYPDRFMGFASMPTKVPGACADELQRCVEELGFKGALTHGLTDGGSLMMNGIGRCLSGRHNLTCRFMSTLVLHILL